LTVSALRGYEIAKNFRERGVPVVLGGMHVTACPDEAAGHANTIVIGEAEDTWPQLLRDFASGKLKKIYRSSNSADLSNLPFPRRDLVDKKRYVTVNTVQATRGCPFHCEFCSITALFGHKTRLRPVEEVIEEIKTLEGDIFVLNDDNLAQKTDYFKELYRNLIPLKKKWVGNASINIIEEEEALDLLRRSGCRGVAVGFESIKAQEGVTKIPRHRDRILRYKEVVRKFHQHHIKVMGDFIFGFDNEDESIFERTLEFTLESKIDIAQLNILTPYPGTPLYKRLEKEGRITERCWDNYRSSNLCFELKSMSRDTFLEKFTWVRSRFYSYPQIALRVMRAWPISTPDELLLLVVVNLGNRRTVMPFEKVLWAGRDAAPDLERQLGGADGGKRAGFAAGREIPPKNRQQ